MHQLGLFALPASSAEEIVEHTVDAAHVFANANDGLPHPADVALDADTLRRIRNAETVGVEAWAMVDDAASVRRLHSAGKIRCVESRTGKTVPLSLVRGLVLQLAR